MTDAGYDATLGTGYALRRRPDPRIAAQIERALGGARRVVNVGAGAGSYEPAGREVTAVEPSAVMRAQRPPGAAPCVAAAAGALPFEDGAFDAAMAVLTMHHWDDWRAGCAELARVAPRRVVLSWSAEVFERFWLVADYLPCLAHVDRERFPASIEEQAEALGADRIEVVPVPADCTDGFLGAYWRRPGRYLDPAVRASMSVFALAPPDDVETGLRALEADLRNGAWQTRHADLLERDAVDLGYRLLIAGP